MKIDEFLKNEKNLDQAEKCKGIDEFKKFVDKNDVFYFTGEQLKKAYNYVRACSPGQDGSLDDDALEVVAGGQGGVIGGVFTGIDVRSSVGGSAVMTYGCCEGSDYEGGKLVSPKYERQRTDIKQGGIFTSKSSIF